MANPNRGKGIRWELKALSMLRKLFPNVVTSRSESRATDAKKIDLMNTGNFCFQCKNLKQIGKAPQFLLEIETEEKIKVLALKHNSYRGAKGELAILYFEDFVKLLNLLES